MRGPISSTMRKIWKKICKSKAYRDSYVAAHVSNTVAAQITLMREERDWTQSLLAEKAGMKQSRISTLEDPNYENIEVATLRRLASAFDVGLTIRFVPFSELVSWAEHHTASELNVPTLENDALIYAPAKVQAIEGLGPLVTGSANDSVIIVGNPIQLTPGGKKSPWTGGPTFFKPDIPTSPKQVSGGMYAAATAATQLSAFNQVSPNG